MRHPPTDAELDDWIRRFTPSLFAVVRACTRDDDDAEDLLQELWIRATERAHRRPEAMPLGAWLHVVALNLARSALRRERRRARLRQWFRGDLPRADVAVPAAPPPLDASPLWRAVAALRRLQREVVLLRLVERRSTAETAAALGRAEGTVKASLHRAIATLRTRLAPGGAAAGMPDDPRLADADAIDR